MRTKEQISKSIASGKTVLGIEMGSTRIKAVLIDETNEPVASGGFGWENQLENGIWTYDLDDVWTGLQESFSDLAKNVKDTYGVELKKLQAIGISGMMHGYLVLDKNDKQLVPFRTWRNTITERAAEALTKEFSFNIPQRWSIAHLYQAILNEEEHVGEIEYLTTLAGYVHWRLTGEKVMGVGEASGMFPVDSTTHDYNSSMIQKFDNLVEDKGFDWKIKDILPRVLSAGEPAGALTAKGAKLLDPSGNLEVAVPLCPPEGDAGTGMVATNSISKLTGNVSAGTSIFAMIVLEKELSNVYPEIDMVTTPAGLPVAMVHCNNFTSDFDAWVNLFKEATEALGYKVEKPKLYDALYYAALEADTDGGGLMAYNYLSGEHITNLEEGRPLFTRLPDSKLTLPNFIRTLLFSAMGTLKIGMDILSDNESVHLEQLQGHGGFFKTEMVGQRLMASALEVPVSVMKSAGEGGAWGIALLAGYLVRKGQDEKLESYLASKVFKDNEGSTIQPDKDDTEGFKAFMKRYKDGLAIEKAAVENLK